MSGEAKDITYRFRWTPEVYAQLSAKRPPAALQVTGSRKQLAMTVIACGALVTGIAALPIPLGLSDYDGFMLSLWGGHRGDVLGAGGDLSLRPAHARRRRSRHPRPDRGKCG